MKTTPGCQEVVDWTIFPMPVFISERRIVTYRSENGLPLGQPPSTPIVHQRPQQQPNQNVNQENYNNRPGHLVFPSEISMESQEGFYLNYYIYTVYMQ